MTSLRKKNLINVQNNKLEFLDDSNPGKMMDELKKILN
jgi:hypothetical protein